MDEADAIDPDVTDLVVQLCTRVGMLMEDASPMALDASHEGLKDRLAELVNATGAIATVAHAAAALLK